MTPIRLITVTPAMLPKFEDIEAVPMMTKESRAKIKAHFAAKAPKVVQVEKREKVPNPAPIERRKPKRKPATKP